MSAPETNANGRIVFSCSGLVTPSIRLAALDFGCDTEPEAADLFLIRCSFYSELARTMRGGGTSDRSMKEDFATQPNAFKVLWLPWREPPALDAQDPTAYACILPSLTIFGQLQPHQEWAFLEAIKLAPELVPAHHTVVITLSETVVWQPRRVPAVCAPCIGQVRTWKRYACLPLSRAYAGAEPLHSI